MKPSLQLRLGQQLTMTPQLQQAIRLLQLSTLDLQQEIQEVLESNPLLEHEEYLTEQEAAARAKKDDEAAPLDSDYSAEQKSDNEADSSQLDTSEALTKQEFSEEAPLDHAWEESYSASSSSSGGARDDMDNVFHGETSENIQDHLLWQMRLTPFSDIDNAIAVVIIDGINNDGYLTVELDDIVSSMNIHDPADGEHVQIDLAEVEVVLKRIQHFDPVGVAARNVAECLMIQLQQLSPETPWLAQAKQTLSQFMPLLANRDFRQLTRKLRIKEDDLRQVLKLIQALDPKPGISAVPEPVEYVIPDVSVFKKQGQWVVELNPDIMPKLRVNAQYAGMTKGSGSSADKQFIRSNLQEAKWFIKSLESRNDTLLKVSRCIVQHQQAFFEYGAEAMKPMVLNDIAEAVEMHESTISRVTTQKYMHTPRGIFELKYFFSSHVATVGGGECSSTAIRAFIKKLVEAEIRIKPLSDSKMAELLAEQGIKVARRTIAKYRESLGIPPSNQRKSLI